MIYFFNPSGKKKFGLKVGVGKNHVDKSFE